MPDSRKARLRGHLDDWRLGFTQEQTGLNHPALEDPLTQRPSGAKAHDLRQMARSHMQRVGDITKGDRLSEPLVDDLECQAVSFEQPDEVREFPNGRAEILKVGGVEIGRLVFQPGWRWSNDVKPIAGTDSCTAPHFQYHVSGRLAILMDDGTEFIAVPGEVTSLPSGHDAWEVGDEPVIAVDWFGASNYAR